ncbi:undecaprenyl-diphosphate phosphatase [Actinoalloteichus hymeniacidonis]|uniref:Undecaprenyl-diphosphatase n=1 Tax=Actinoalloteichus hymeniacidonis TaxID=340345 RepID=A0AAC9HQV8_9PSEU|nr:undecaprenyl-diphosphate phosphatase [Actinoalloteichus hymeniacidonis]AOS63668.1 undecaprenyl-diphosphatase UppP [Actinoalloteichus hymeniacidonis]MBB5908283.1 undecaprenyl-diphosphatase [Actinoalloteichus hymeniacidonis]
MTWIEALVLGLVQGLTEFLPVSSSGHLRIVSEFFFQEDAGASFTAVTQLGTEAAVLIYFAKDIGRLFMVWLRGFRDPSVRSTPDYKLAWYVIIGTIPIGVLGLLFADQIRTTARNLWLIGTTLIVFGVLLGLAEYLGRQRREMSQLTLKDGIIMGFAQSMALIPGVSRSGGTITAGLFLGLNRPTAVRFSFLLAIPAVVASGLSELPEVFETGGPGLQPSGAQMLVATLVAGAVGYAIIAWLMKYVERHSVYLFVWYRIALGLLVLGLLSFGVISPV